MLLWKKVGGGGGKVAFHKSLWGKGFTSQSLSGKGIGDRERIETDILIVGGGPAGLAAAIRLGQLAKERQHELNIMLIEKGSEIGSHILSGAVMEPRAFEELFPDWREDWGANSIDPAPLRTPANHDKMLLLTEKRAIRLPTLKEMRNKGNWIVSLSEVTRWMGRRAEELGVGIFSGFSGQEVLYDEKGEVVVGVATNDVGINRQGKPKDNFARGMEIRARLTFFAEGCHGSLTKSLIKKFDLSRNSDHQTYGLGLKEVWEVPERQHQAGLVVHAVGWPLDSNTYGGAFMYHYDGGMMGGGEGGNNGGSQKLVSIGLVVGLDYRNPFLNPYKEFQRLKTHRAFRNVLEGGGQCVAYGARALNEGGIQSIPRLVFPGGVLVGCTAGFMNVPKIKGSHTAMKSGILAAEAAFSAITASNPNHDEALGRESIILEEFEESLKSSWVGQELWKVRNIRPAFQKMGLYAGILYTGLDQIIFRGKVPWTFHHGKPDYAQLEPANQHLPIDYPKADGKLTFELLESVSRTGTNHVEDQPVHLQLNDSNVQVKHNFPLYAGPEQRFCPAGVYEYVPCEGDPSKVRFQINAQNCIHCKTCDIKDPSQNINWVPPEGGGGPQYTLT